MAKNKIIYPTRPSSHTRGRCWWLGHSQSLIPSDRSLWKTYLLSSPNEIAHEDYARLPVMWFNFNHTRFVLHAVFEVTTQLGFLFGYIRNIIQYIVLKWYFSTFTCCNLSAFEQSDFLVWLWKLLTVKLCILADFIKRMSTWQWFGLSTPLLYYCLHSCVNIDGCHT